VLGSRELVPWRDDSAGGHGPARTAGARLLSYLRRLEEAAGVNAQLGGGSRDGDLNWAIMAAGSREDAERYAIGQGLGSFLVLSKAELLEGPLAFRRRLKAHGVNAFAVHSRSWRRQGSPQVYELALALAPVTRRRLVDEEDADTRDLHSRELARRVSMLPRDVIDGFRLGAQEVRAFAAARGRPPPLRDPQPLADRSAVMAIWHGQRGVEIGGATTHIAGILGGFRALGFRIGLVTTEQPPPQLGQVVDDVEITAPLPRGGRLTGDVEALAINGPLRRSALALGRRLGPALVYQRHRGYLIAGADVARATCAPLILEWNNSETWMRDNYEQQMWIERIFDPLIAAMEHYVVRMADLTAAVSEPAADMAHARGGSRERVAVVPNGVDLERIDREVSKAALQGCAPQPLVGWIGSFGPWHGAEVLVRALPLLPASARLLMIGDGELREACETSARELGVWERIEWTGSLPHSEAVRRLAQCDVLASPHVRMPGQRFFGSPTKLFEYMALGRPIVASRLEQIGEVLDDGRTARLVAPGDERQLARAIDQVLTSPDQGRELGRAARREARQHTWDQRARTILTRLHAATVASSMPIL
jgi:glycosyltransferase involved in cell wall biosynthesis